MHAAPVRAPPTRSLDELEAELAASEAEALAFLRRSWTEDRAGVLGLLGAVDGPRAFVDAAGTAGAAVESAGGGAAAVPGTGAAGPVLAYTRIRQPTLTPLDEVDEDALSASCTSVGCALERDAHVAQTAAPPAAHAAQSAARPIVRQGPAVGVSTGAAHGAICSAREPSVAPLGARTASTAATAAAPHADEGGQQAKPHGGASPPPRAPLPSAAAAELSLIHI